MEHRARGGRKMGFRADRIAERRAGAGRARLALLAGLLGSLAVACSEPPKVVIDSPPDGTFTTGSSIGVTGHLENIDLESVVELRIQGAPVPVDEVGNFSTSVALPPGQLINSVVAELDEVSGFPRRAAITVFQGDSIADGDFSLEGIALRLTDSGLDAVEPLIETLAVAGFDIATLLPPGTEVISNFCAVDGGIFGCLGRADVFIDSPPPTVSSIGLDFDSVSNAVDGLVVVDDIHVNLRVEGSGAAPSCDAELDATALDITGLFDLAPDPVDATLIDLNQQGPLGLAFSGFDFDFTSGICDFPLIGDLISLIIGDVQPLVLDGFRNFLDDPDGSGPADGPLADGFELALAVLNAGGAIGSQLGVALESPLFTIDEDADGITFGSDARITASMPHPDSPDITASYDVTDPFPTFGPTAPDGSPFDLGLCISTSTFNQLLKADTESGLLLYESTEIDLGSGPVPLTGGLLAALAPAFSVVDPAAPAMIRLRPTTSPIITGEPGPAGELALVRLGGLEAEVVLLQGGAELVALRIALNVDIGSEIDFVDGVIVFDLSPTTANDVEFTIFNNLLGADEAGLQLLVPTLVDQALPSLEDSLEGFPLPDFLGIELSKVDVDRNGEFFSVYFDML